MPDDCLEVFRLHPARIAQVYLVVETDPRDDSIAVQKAEDVLRVRTARVSDVEAKVLISNKTRKLRDRCGLIVVGAFVHDLRASSFRETDEAQISVFDCGREFGLLVDDERADVLECLGDTKSGWRMRDTQDNELLSDIPVPSNASDRVPRPGPCDWPGRVSWAGRPDPAASRGGTDEAVLWAHLGRPHDTVTALGARRRHDAARGAQARARVGRAGVADPMRRDLPSPAPTTRPVGGVPHLRTGQDGSAWLRRATCAHGAGPGPPRAHGGRPADRRARAIPGARLRRARRDLSFGPRQPARTRGDGRPVGGAGLPAGGTGPRHDNAVAEPFFGTSGDETCHPRSFATRKEARLASAGYVEGYHDRRRPHSTIDYHIPAEEMDALFERMDAMVAREEALPLAA